MVEGLGNASTSKVTYTDGGMSTVLSNLTDAGLKTALAAASAAEQVVLYLGIDGTVEGEGHDRHEITLPVGQMDLAKVQCSIAR
jgi:hypothetical protein